MVITAVRQILYAGSAREYDGVIREFQHPVVAVLDVREVAVMPLYSELNGFNSFTDRPEMTTGVDTRAFPGYNRIKTISFMQTMKVGIVLVLQKHGLTTGYHHIYQIRHRSPFHN
jgi:hypothetical protein